MKIPPPSPEAIELFRKGALVLSKMEHNGIRIDVPCLEKTIKEVSNRIDQITGELKEDRIWKTWENHFGEKTNLSSLPQLGEVLFGVLDFTCSGGKTKTERWKTDEDTIRAVAIPFTKSYLELSKLKKLKSTYLEGTLKEVVDGYVHPVFNQHTVATFRSSSDSPNWQNIPSRYPEYARMIRQAVVPRKGRVLVENDFGALEFRIACSVWNDPKMIAYATDPTKDIHRDLAAKCFLLDPRDVSKECRYVGKNGFVFPLIYGSYHRQIARNMWNMMEELKLKNGIGEKTISLKKHLRAKGIKEMGRCEPGKLYEPMEGTFEWHIKKVEEWFWNEFSVFRDKKREWVNLYRERGWFKTVTGFVLSGLYTVNFLLNAPIQGPGFHCLLWTIIRIQEEIERRKMKTLLIAQIHDCSIADVPEEELQEYLTMVDHIVSVELPKVWSWIRVPMLIEAEVAETNWFEKKQWICRNGKWGPK